MINENSIFNDLGELEYLEQMQLDDQEDDEKSVFEYTTTTPSFPAELEYSVESSEGTWFNPPDTQETRAPRNGASTGVGAIAP